MAHKMNVPFHALANLFPLIVGPAFDELVSDIRDHGQRDKIVLFEGAILDGRNRYRACITAGLDAEFEEYSGADPVSFVVSKNIHRRHLTEGQRGAAAAELCTLKRGRPTKASENTSQDGISTFEAAQQLRVSPKTVERAKDVKKRSPALFQAVKDGKIDVSTAQKASKLPEKQQQLVIEEAEAGHANVVRNVVKQGTREVREADLGKKQAELPDKKFGIILADPEWEFVVFSKTTGLDRSADNHYPTSSEEQIAARDVQKIAAQDCLLALWVTDLARGIRVMQSWGFEYKSYFVWVKDIVEVPREGGKRTLQEVGPAGTGYWNRDRDELLLIGTRGKIPAPAMGTQGESVIFAARPKATGTERGRHSAKPPQIHEWLEKHYPTLPKIELNARTRRPGWEVWGNEAPEEERSQDAHVLDVADENQDRFDPAMENQDHGEHYGQEVRATGDEGNSGLGDHEDQREHDVAAGERAERGSDHHPDSGEVVGHAVTRPDQAGAGQPSQAEGLVLQVISDRPAPMEIPSFLRRTKTEDVDV